MKHKPLALAAVTLLVAAGSASAACDANSNALSNCLVETVNGAKATIGTDNDAEKAQSVGEAIENCVTCAADQIGDSLSNFGKDSTDKSSDESN